MESVTVEVVPEVETVPLFRVHWLLERVLEPVNGPISAEAVSFSRKIPVGSAQTQQTFWVLNAEPMIRNR